MKRIILLMIVVIVFIVMLLQGCRGIGTPKLEATPKAPEVTTEQEKTEKPEAPNITFLDSEGNNLRLSDFKEKVILLNFWGTWCPPCRGEMPDIEKVYQEYKDKNVQIIAANVQGVTREKDIDGVKQWFENKGYTMPLMFVDYSDASKLYGVNAFPTSVIISAKGLVEFYKLGPITEEQIKKELDYILNQGE